MGKVLVVEPIVDRGVEILQEAGHTVDIQLELDEKALLEALKNTDALIVRSGTQVTPELLKAGPELKVVGRAGVGVDNVDVGAATELGIMVVNTPEANILSAAEHTMALILAQARNIPQAHTDLKSGKWERTIYGGVELSDKVLGIVGLGRIGQLVAHRAKAFGMRMVAYDPYVSEERASHVGVELLDLRELMGISDFVTLHVITTPETRHMMNAEMLAAAKPGLRLINVSRGEAVDEDALADAIRSGQIAGAALDVFTSEPPDADSPLLKLPQVVSTPHLGASTKEAQDRVGITVAEQVALALAGELPPFAMNISAQVVPGILRPFLPLCEQLGRLLASMEAGEAQSDVVNVGFHGEIGSVDVEAAALAVMTGMLKAVSDQPVSYVNAKALAENRGLRVVTHKVIEATDYVNEVSISRGDRFVSGTVVGLNNEPRLTRIDRHKVNMPAADHMMLIENDDHPGVIGFVGTVMGNVNLNIDDMHVGKSRGADKTTLTVISMPEPASEEVKRIIEMGEGVVSVRLIEL